MTGFNAASWMKAIFAIILGSLLIFAVINPSYSYCQEKTQEDSLAFLLKAHGQLEIAMKYAELGLSSHQPGTGWHQTHIQRAMNVLSGKGGPNFNEKSRIPEMVMVPLTTSRKPMKP